MRDFLINYASYIVWFLAISELALCIASFKDKGDELGILTSAVCFGLAVDALIQAIGIFVGAGTFLQSLSQIRYILHGILVPLLIPIAFYTYGIKSKTAKTILWVFTGVVIACGVAMGFMTKTEPVLFAGVLRYGTSSLNPKFADVVNRILSFGGVIPLIVMGVAHIFKNKSPYLLLSGLVMFGFSALAPATHNMDLNFITTMIGEDLMVFFFSLELLRIRRKRK